ncbi:MAG: hypothetical protein DCF25_16585 [Leptolyngbya foveolarum]|uniref:DUF4058 domain-containing protein n=1 Tax=Leptolyngbya foveolarum TaxID=47253 RepID=A0A2W4U1Z9_9CYAN|nr:MAG: hypothetical protein DCF25_16585 [Leptolyngbya foveolarum]
MPSPFPGMNPYLENPGMWAEVHNRLIVAISIALAPALHPKYYAAIDKRTYLDTPEDSILIGIPDVSIASERNLENRSISKQSTLTLSQPEVVTLPFPEEVTERYLEIREAKTNAVITAIEILSPKNKKKGEGKTTYLEKRQRVLSTQTHFIEIDLLRGQPPMPVISKNHTDYRILVSRSNTRPKAELYGFNLFDPIPTFAVPIQSGDTEPQLDLKKLIDEVYDQSGYGFRLDYQQPVKPALTAAEKQQVKEILSSDR